MTTKPSAAMLAGRRPLVSGNWKMHHDHIQAVRYGRRLAECLRRADAERVEVTLRPPFIDLHAVRLAGLDQVPVALGAQNCHYADDGAFTGEISPAMLAKLGVRYAILGHSERPQQFGEDDTVVNRKVRARAAPPHDADLVCVGETPQPRAAGLSDQTVAGQVRPAWRASPRQPWPAW